MDVWKDSAAAKHQHHSTEALQHTGLPIRHQGQLVLQLPEAAPPSLFPHILVGLPLPHNSALLAIG